MFCWAGFRSGVTAWALGCSVLSMARSRELWLGIGSFAIASAALVAAVGASANGRTGNRLWSSAPMMGAYLICVLGLASLWAAIRDWRIPFAADRSGRLRDAVELSPAEWCTDPLADGRGADV
jgi:hypothetical protein